MKGEQTHRKSAGFGGLDALPGGFSRLMSVLGGFVGCLGAWLGLPGGFAALGAQLGLPTGQCPGGLGCSQAAPGAPGARGKTGASAAPVLPWGLAGLEQPAGRQRVSHVFEVLRMQVLAQCMPRVDSCDTMLCMLGILAVSHLVLIMHVLPKRTHRAHKTALATAQHTQFDHGQLYCLKPAQREPPQHKALAQCGAQDLGDHPGVRESRAVATGHGRVHGLAGQENIACGGERHRF